MIHQGTQLSLQGTRLCVCRTRAYIQPPPTQIRAAPIRPPIHTAAWATSITLDRSRSLTRSRHSRRHRHRSASALPQDIRSTADTPTPRIRTYGPTRTASFQSGMEPQDTSCRSKRISLPRTERNRGHTTRRCSRSGTDRCSSHTSAGRNTARVPSCCTMSSRCAHNGRRV